MRRGSDSSEPHVIFPCSAPLLLFFHYTHRPFPLAPQFNYTYVYIHSNRLFIIIAKLLASHRLYQCIVVKEMGTNKLLDLHRNGGGHYGKYGIPHLSPHGGVLVSGNVQLHVL
jgi:hypothetical protein